MKQIFLSLLIISALSILLIGATMAFFSDTETSTGNTFTAGTLNLTVKGEDPLKSALVKLDDMKPSEWFAVQTSVVVEDDPADLYKHFVEPIECEDNIITEPECDEGGGIWTGTECTEDYVPKNDLYNYITIDLAICWDMNENGKIDKELDEYGTPTPDSECEVIIYGHAGKKLGERLSEWILLKENIDSEREYIVHQSFHLQPEVTNWAQEDMCIFSEEFLANQVGAPVPKEEECIDTEICDGKDNDCDGEVDEELSKEGTNCGKYKCGKYCCKWKMDECKEWCPKFCPKYWHCEGASGWVCIK